MELIRLTWLKLCSLIRVRYFNFLPCYLLVSLTRSKYGSSNLPSVVFFCPQIFRNILASNLNTNLQMSHPTERRKVLRDKAIAVARRVSVTKDEDLRKVSCPVCFHVLSSKTDSDIGMLLALHLSLWHPDDVNLQWEIMQNKKKSNVHVPSFVLGVGIAAGFGALLAACVFKNHSQSLVGKRER